MRHNACHDCTQVGRKSTTAVETKPSNPEEDGTQDDVRNIVWSVGKTVDLGVASSLAQHERHSESGGSGRDVDGRASGKVKAAKLEGPSVRVPGPVGDGVVYDG